MGLHRSNHAQPLADDMEVDVTHCYPSLFTIRFWPCAVARERPLLAQSV
jgi:hypothetical protein